MPSRRYRVSVRALADFCQIQGDLISVYRPGPSAFEGQQTHNALQSKRAKPYQAETPLSFRWQNPAFELVVSGRADGTFPDGVEEIKTTRVPPHDIPGGLRDLHHSQAKLYAAIYALQFDAGPVLRVCNTYVHPQTLEEWPLEHAYPVEQLLDYLLDCCLRYDAWLMRVDRHQRDRQPFLAQLSFPFATMRPAQRQMAESVYKACRVGKDLCVEAPTGTGKTLAALFPALKAMTEVEVRSLFFLTMKTTGQVAAHDALQRLDPEHRLSVVALTAKTRLCRSPDTPCDGQFCPYARDYFAKRDRLREQLFEPIRWDPDALIELAEKEQICPYYLSQDWAIWSDVVIGDLNYIYDTTAVQPYLLREIDNRATVLIDECHNLIDRGRMMFSAEFSGLALQQLMHQCPKKIQNRLRKIQTRLREVCTKFGPGLCYESPQTLLHSLRDFMADSAALLRDNPQFEPDALWQPFLFSCTRFIRLHDLADAGDFCWRYGTGSPELRGIELICLNPARLLMSKHQLVNNVVAFSATLKPWPYSQQLNGLAGAITQELPSPFQASQFKVYLANDVSTRFRDRIHLPERLRPLLNSLVGNGKNTLVFFSSYQQLQQAARLLDTADALLVQRADWTARERDAVLAQFRAQRGLTLLTVLGGVFGEGIDLPGEQLEQVVVIGPGLPQVNEVNNAIRLQMDQQQLPGFDFAYAFPGLQKVLQAAGRCVRTDTDQGEILLIDDRFDAYGQQGWLPVHWTVHSGPLQRWPGSIGPD